MNGDDGGDRNKVSFQNPQTLPENEESKLQKRPALNGSWHFVHVFTLNRNLTTT